MEIKLKEYLNDGSDWQSQAVMAYLRSTESYFLGCHFISDCNSLVQDYYLTVGRIDNCREQGHVYKLLSNDRHTLCYFWVCQFRSTDNICVRFFTPIGSDIYTPSIMAGIPKKEDWYIDKSFECGQIVECGKFIFGILKQKMDDFEKQKIINGDKP